MVRVLVDLLNTPSPTGYTDWAAGFVENELDLLGAFYYRTPKGAVVASFDGLREDHPRAITAHIDTLGAMVREIKPNGRLKLTKLNGVLWPTVESEGVTVHCGNDRQVRGSIVFANGAAHVNKAAATGERNEDSLEVRLDERTSSADETRVLGISVGDFVAFDPRVEVSNAGFVRSRFLDDKAGVAAMLAALKALRDNNLAPAQRTTFLFSNFEEVGHGGYDGIPSDVVEYVVVDMAAIGIGQASDEFHCTICMKDSGGPYSRALTEKLRRIAERAEIDLIADIYPHYSSDGTAYWHAGGPAEVALIGPGVDTSHGYERTHVDAMRDTASLIAEYLVAD